MIPTGITAYLASNLDFTGAAIRQMLPLSGATVAIIPTATYGEGRPLNPDQQQAYEAAGARVLVCDLADMAGEEDTYRALSSAQVLHLCGGNTFALLHALYTSGFAGAVRRMGRTQPRTVVGESAGAIVLGADIAHIAPLDDPSVAPSLATTQALGWVPDLIVPHYKAEAWGFGARIDAWLAKDPAAATYTLLRDTEYLRVCAQGQDRTTIHP